MTADPLPDIEHCVHVAKPPDVVFRTLTTAEG